MCKKKKSNRSRHAAKVYCRSVIGNAKKGGKRKPSIDQSVVKFVPRPADASEGERSASLHGNAEIVKFVPRPSKNGIVVVRSQKEAYKDWVRSRKRSAVHG